MEVQESGRGSGLGSRLRKLLPLPAAGGEDSVPASPVLQTTQQQWGEAAVCELQLCRGHCAQAEEGHRWRLRQSSSAAQTKEIIRWVQQ